MTRPWYHPRRLWGYILASKGRERWLVFIAAILFGIAIVGYLVAAVWVLVSTSALWVWYFAQWLWGLVMGGAAG
jgi:hypothetical protein